MSPINLCRWQVGGMKVEAVGGAIAECHQLLPTLERSKRLLLCMEFGDKAVATRVKARVNYPEIGNTLGLLPNQGRCRVSIVTNLGITDGIARKGRGLLSHECPRYRDRTWLLVKQDIWYVSTASSQDI